VETYSRPSGPKPQQGVEPSTYAGPGVEPKLLELAQDDTELMLEHSRREVILVGEVVVELALPAAGLHEHVLHRGPANAVLVHQPRGGVDDRVHAPSSAGCLGLYHVGAWDRSRAANCTVR